jgi:hypothetical protein
MFEDVGGGNKPGHGVMSAKWLSAQMIFRSRKSLICVGL